MANGNSCYLCGGKLRRGRCVECGLDNDRMTRRDYRLNVTTPYHVKKQQVAARKAENMKYAKDYKAKQASLENLGKPLNQQQKPKTGRRKEVAGSKKKWKGISIAGVIWVIFMLITEVGGCIADIADEFSIATPEYEYSDYAELEETVSEPHGAIPEEDYTYVTRELSETGEFYEEEFGPGFYIVGVHIPEGTYMMQISEGTYVSSYIQDNENSIYMSPSFGEDSYDGYLTLEDVRLYTGACVEINGAGAISFISDNAQTDLITGMENPMDASAVGTFDSDEYESMELVVGEDIPAGIYDVSALSGWSSVCVTYHLDEENSYEYYYWLDADTLEHTYKNVALIEGMTVTVENCEIQFTPSSWIATDHYETYFMNYYYNY